MKNPVAKNLHKFNRPSTMPNKRRQVAPSRSACLLDEQVSDIAEMQVEEANELIDEVKTECLSHEEE